MLNRNVADYTNFDGKTNKKIVQAPGGLSSINLGWSNQKTDYGSERAIKKANRQSSYSGATQRRQEQIDYSEPMRVMQPYGGPSQPKVGYQPYLQNNMQGYNQQTQNLGHPQNYEPQYGYKQQPSTRQHSYSGYQDTPNRNNYSRGQVQQIDLAVHQHEMGIKNRPPSMPRRQAYQPSQNSPLEPTTKGRSCIKINAPPRQNMIFGNQEYNYWKEDVGNGKRQIQRGNQTFGQRPPPQEYTTEKTSVKVHNPPGGKQTFTFG